MDEAFSNASKALSARKKSHPHHGDWKFYNEVIDRSWSANPGHGPSIKDVLREVNLESLVHECPELFVSTLSTLSGMHENNLK